MKTLCRAIFNFFSGLRPFAVALLSVLATSGFAQGQQQNKQVINTRAKLLMHKPQETSIEQIDSFHTLHLIIGGNIYQTERQVAYAYDTSSRRYDFKGELKYVEPILNLGDITIANLKTSFGDEAANIFSSPDEFAIALKYAGVTAVMHANQHTANINKATLMRTRDVLNEFDMYHTGAFADKYERDGNYPLIISKKGFKIAVLNYTYLPSRPQASRDFFINEMDKSYIDKDMRLAFAYKPDFIIVYFNWGEDGQEIPNHIQQEMAQYVFNKGANLVVGACPNKPMRVDYLNYFYNQQEREGVVAYSLGNLIASNEDLKNRNGYLIDMDLKKNEITGETKIDDWGVLPVYTYYDTTTTPGKTKVYSLPCWAVESGDIFAGIPYIEKRRVVNSAYEIRKMLGSTTDEVQYNMTEHIVNNVAEAIQITNASLNNKFSQAHEKDIKPSAPPFAPNLMPGTNNTLSLAMVQEQTDVQPKAEPKVEKKKRGSYEAERKKAEEAFNNQPNEEVKATPPPNEPDTAKPIAERLKQSTLDNSSQNAQVLNSNADITTQPTLSQQTSKSLVATTDTFYRIQFYALKKYIPLDTNYYTHLKGYEAIEEDGLFKYYLGLFKTYKECFDYWKQQIQPRYKESFIVTYVNGKRNLK